MRWVAVLVAIGLPSCSAAGSEPAAASAAVLEPCTIAGIAETARCTTVQVRESSTSTRTIDIRVIVLPSLAQPPLPDPIVPLAGGPGQGVTEAAAYYAQRFAFLRDRRELLLIDRRGTGDSNPLQCDMSETAVELVGALFNAGRLAACRDQLATRAELTQYTTAAAAADYETVFDQLGYREVNLAGVSYGTRMAQEIARHLPQRVRTMFIEGVVPMDFTWPANGAADLEASLTQLIDDCVADASCAERYPRFRQDVDVAFARVRRDPVTVAVRDPAHGLIERVPFAANDLAYAIRGLLYGNDSLALPLWFRQAAEGDFTAFAQAYISRARSLDASITRGVLFGVYCAEDVPFVDTASAARRADGTRIGTYLLDEYRKGCSVWPAVPVEASFRAPVQSNVPTLLMAGRHDPVTPPRTATDVMRTLPRSRLVLWPRGGHGTDGLASGNCRAAIVSAFITTADPSSLSLDCVTRDAARPFVTG